MLPAWLGSGTALQKAVESGKQDQLETMCRDWPFFSTRIGMLEMVFAKSDLWLAEYYDQRLVEESLWPLGKQLRQQLEDDINVVLTISNDDHLMADLPWIAESIAPSNVYTDPLNVLQAELLHRSRQQEHPDTRVEQALMVNYRRRGCETLAKDGEARGGSKAARERHGRLRQRAVTPANQKPGSGKRYPAARLAAGAILISGRTPSVWQMA